MIQSFQQPFVPVRQLDEALRGLKVGSGEVTIRGIEVTQVFKDNAGPVPFFCPSNLDLLSFTPDRNLIGRQIEVNRKIVREWGTILSTSVIFGGVNVDWKQFTDSKIDIHGLSFVITKEGVVLRVTPSTIITPVADTVPRYFPSSRVFLRGCPCDLCRAQRGEVFEELSSHLRRSRSSMTETLEAFRNFQRAVREE